MARHIRGRPDTTQPIVAKEAEFPIRRFAPQLIGTAPSLFFCHDLDGYGWCVPKGEYVNVGIGRRTSEGFSIHVKDFIARLEALDVHAADADIRWHGHAYFASGVGPRPLIGNGVILIGDAAGLAYPDSGEGICPSIESGQLAADTLVAARGRHETDDLRPYVDAMRVEHPPAHRWPPRARAWSARLGRALLRSPLFSRHVVLDRWFLRGGDSAVARSAAGRAAQRVALAPITRQSLDFPERDGVRVREGARNEVRFHTIDAADRQRGRSGWPASWRRRHED